MDDEPDISFVDSHPECDSGHDYQNFIVHPFALHQRSLRISHSCVIEVALLTLTVQKIGQ